jgi:hypothetical protein
LVRKSNSKKTRITLHIYFENCRPQEEPQLGEALRSALLEAQQEATFDAEHGANGTDSHATTSSSNGKRRRSRSWISLVGYAARYMWPDGFWLRVRAGACVLLILIMRLLNLAVPLLWKKVVDEFSALTAATHRTDGKPPETVPFAVAFVPWVAAWLGLYLLQGGGGGGGAIGLLSNVRSFLWIPISQNSFRYVLLLLLLLLCHERALPASNFEWRDIHCMGSKQCV